MYVCMYVCMYAGTCAQQYTVLPLSLSAHFYTSRNVVGSDEITTFLSFSRTSHYSVNECVAVRCSALQCAAVRCSVLQSAALCLSFSLAPRPSVTECIAVYCSAVQYVAVCCSRCVFTISRLLKIVGLFCRI